MAFVEEKDLGWDRILKAFGELQGSKAEAGLWGSGDGPETNVAARGLMNEYEFVNPKTGVVNPERPFMRQAIDGHEQEIQDFVANTYWAILEGRITPEQGMKKIGVYLEGLIKKEITDGNFKENSPVTIALKGSSKPLIATGEMRQSVTSKVKMKGGNP